MTPTSLLHELLMRVGASGGASVFISDHECSQWPVPVLGVFQKQGMLVKAKVAGSVVCPGCERECSMPVHVLRASTGIAAAFVVCDKRNDINRVSIPTASLDQWQVSGDSIASLLAKLLNLTQSKTGGASASRWNVGLFKGAKHTGYLSLAAEGKLVLHLSGHAIDLTEVLEIESGKFKIDLKKLKRYVDNPVVGHVEDKETVEQRRARLKNRVQALKKSGVKAFLKVIATEEEISISRVKQILKEDTQTSVLSSDW